MSTRHAAAPDENAPVVLREKASDGPGDRNCCNLRSNGKQAQALSEAIDVIARSMDTESGPKSIYAVALRGLQNALGIDRASILFFDPDGVMRFKAWLGISDTYRNAVEGHTPWAPETIDPEPVVVSDVVLDPTLTSYLPTFAREDIRALAFIPLLYRGRVLGKFMLYSRVPYHFTDEMEFALALGRLIAFGIFRTKAEEELRANEEMFRASEARKGAILDTALDCIITIDHEGRIIEFNRAAEMEFGHAREDVLGKEMAELLLPARYREAHRKGLATYLRTGEGPILGRRIEAQAIHANGTLVPVELSVTRIPTAGAPIFTGFIRNISERKKTQEVLRQAKETLELRVHERTMDLSRANVFLSSLIENLPNMIFVKDAKELRFVRFNKAGEELIGYSREDLLGKNDYDLFPESEARFFTAMDRSVLENRSVLDIPEEPIHTRSKGTRLLHTKKIPLYDPQGNPEYLVGISEDITEKKQAEEDRLKLAKEREARLEAEKAIQLRDDFLSIAAHELRTPLTPIRMYLQLVKRYVEALAPDLPKVDLLRKAVISTDQEFERFLRLVENLLDVSRMSAGRLTLERREFDLAELVKSVVNRFGGQLRKAQCDLVLDIPSRVVGQWDQTRVEQVVINLLTNAMKYGSKKPIEVAVSRNDEKAFLEITDHGIGITKDDQEKIFHRFERVAPLKHFGGFGLGLFITREIVNAHGGTIRLTSEPGLGSTFTVELPLG